MLRGIGECNKSYKTDIDAVSWLYSQDKYIMLYSHCGIPSAM